MSQGFASDQIIRTYGENTVTFTDPADPSATGTGKARWMVPPSWVTAEILGIYAACHTAPTGAAIIVDINKNGTTVFTTQGNRTTIAAGSNDSGSEDVPDVVTLASGDYLTMDIDQVGSSVAGAVVSVHVRLARIS